ncbi:HIRAN domain-containing protein [Mycolicibacter icosiumassiliensis]|uniref:HIRAN domain-containing protein n=1 Tax=Mycolicibacter icosiumassiliensis TaxID=1792835 RepID=UPI00082B8C05|nr:HIRAN domain-containing protein [Mycolicibacter icosiumassiliensis]
MTASSSLRVAAAPAIDARRRLFLIWQNPETRQFIRVGILSELVDGRYAFAYTDGAQSDGFNPLVQFPDVNETYVSGALPAFFDNRVMSRQRQSYPDYLSAIGIDAAELDTPMELLARTGGPRATDTFHLVDDLAADHDGRVVSRFLASGVRHVDGAADALSRVRPGDRLELRADRDNAVNPRAQLVCEQSGDALGYVPDWLLDDLDSLLARADSHRIVAERVNPREHPHLRLLCRIEAHV